MPGLLVTRADLQQRSPLQWRYMSNARSFSFQVIISTGLAFWFWLCSIPFSLPLPASLLLPAMLLESNSVHLKFKCPSLRERVQIYLSRYIGPIIDAIRDVASCFGRTSTLDKKHLVIPDVVCMHRTGYGPVVSSWRPTALFPRCN